jgi:HAMP domain-containing protein
LGVRGKQIGTVWFWDHETAEITRLSATFRQFMENLRQRTDEPIALEEPGERAMLSITVPLEMQYEVEALVELIGGQAERAGLGTILGEDSTETEYYWTLECSGDKESLRSLLKLEIGKHPEMAIARISDYEMP